VYVKSKASTEMTLPRRSEMQQVKGKDPTGDLAGRRA
jgi:hypothetical protein